MRMYYRPAPPPPDPEDVVRPLARKLAVFLFDRDPADQEFTYPTGPVRVDASNQALTGFLKALVLCEEDGAADLLEELNRAGALMIWIGSPDEF